jgi:hypothetical protein
LSVLQLEFYTVIEKHNRYAGNNFAERPSDVGISWKLNLLAQLG